MAVSGQDALILRVASIPFIRGIPISMIATSGRNEQVRATASLPSAVCRLPDHVDPVLTVQHAARAFAHQRVVVGDDRPNRRHTVFHDTSTTLNPLLP